MRLLRRNLASVYAVYAFSLASGIVVTPIVVHALGEARYGVWAFIGSATVLLGLLDLGVGPAVVRFAAHARGRGAAGEVGEIASAALAVYAAMAVVAVPAGLALAWLVPPALDLQGDLVWPARIATLLVVASVALRFPFGLAVNLMLAQQRFDVVNLGNVLSIAAYTTLVVVLLRGGGGLVLLAAIALGTGLLRFLVPLAWMRRELPGVRLRLRGVRRERVRELLGFSWHTFVIHVAAKVVFSTDVLIVGLLLGARAAALYAIPAKLFSLGAGVVGAGTNLLYPAFSELEGAEEQERQRRLLHTGLRAGMALTVLVALPLVLVPDLLLRAWLGGGFEESVPVLVLLGTVLVIRQPTAVLSQYLVARGLQARLARLSAAIVAANLALSVALAATVGLWGVALATLVTEALAVVLIAGRLAGVAPLGVAAAALRPLLPALLAAGPVLVLLARALPEGRWSVVLVGLVWTAAAALAVWRLGFARDERRRLGGRLLGGDPRAAVGTGLDGVG
jgi:O-antigen/teichoic acid export membrane protein